MLFYRSDNTSVMREGIGQGFLMTIFFQCALLISSACVFLLLNTNHAYAERKLPEDTHRQKQRTEPGTFKKGKIAGTDQASHRLSIEGSTQRYSFYVEYPSLDNDAIDTSLAMWARNQITTFTHGLDEIPEEDPTRFSLQIKYTLISVSPRTCSVLFSVSLHTGGFTPDHGLATFTFDLQTGKQLTYRDIFQQPEGGLIPFLSVFCYDKLAKRAWAAETPELLVAGTAPELINFSFFTLKSNGMTVYFPPNQVTTAQHGTQEVFIPLQALAAQNPNLAFWGKRTLTKVATDTK